MLVAPKGGARELRLIGQPERMTHGTRKRVSSVTAAKVTGQTGSVTYKSDLVAGGVRSARNRRRTSGVRVTSPISLEPFRKGGFSASTGGRVVVPIA